MNNVLREVGSSEISPYLLLDRILTAKTLIKENNADNRYKYGKDI